VPERELFTPAWRKRERRREAVEIALAAGIGALLLGAALLNASDAVRAPAPALEAPTQIEAPGGPPP